MNEQLKIELIDHMGSDRSVANAAWRGILANIVESEVTARMLYELRS